MLVFHNISNRIIIIPIIFRIFVPMSDKDEIIIERLLNPEKDVTNEFMELCSYAINKFIFTYHEDCKDKANLRLVLAKELYYYILEEDLLHKFEGKSSLKTYLNSIARLRLPRIQLDDPLLIKANEERRKEEKKLEEKIREFDNEPENFHVYKPVPIPTEFRDEDEAFDDAEFFFAGIDEDDCNGEEDVIIDIDNLQEDLFDTPINSTRLLVRQTLDQMPPKEAQLLIMQIIEGYGADELAIKLGHTRNVIYNLCSKAKRDFVTIYTKLNKELS